jgi:polyisoprenoid-binding protein YceI
MLAMRHLVLLVPFVVATSGAAAQPDPGTLTLQMDQNHSSLDVTVAGAKSRFTQAAGALQYDPARPDKNTIALSLDTSSIEAAPARQSFDSDHFPEMRIASTSAAKPGKDGVENLPVNVTIRDITRSAIFHVSLKNGSGQTVEMHAEGTLQSADFHMKPGDIVLVLDGIFRRVAQN